MGARPLAEGAASIVWAAQLGPDGATRGSFSKTTNLWPGA